MTDDRTCPIGKALMDNLRQLGDQNQSCKSTPSARSSQRRSPSFPVRCSCRARRPCQTACAAERYRPALNTRGSSSDDAVRLHQHIRDRAVGWHCDRIADPRFELPTFVCLLFVGVVFSNGLSLFDWRPSEHTVSLLGNVSLALLMTLRP